MEKTCKIYYTSDTHGRLFPENGVGGRCLTACFAEYKKDENTLVLDGGDTLQGAPLLRYLWKNDTCPELLASVMNHGGLDYYTLGNHDFNYGYAALARYVNAVDATCVCANVKDVTASPMDIRPYAIHTLGNGLRIGIVGIVSEYVNLWEAKENLVGLQVSDPFAAAKTALDALKTVEDGVDYTICIYHGGFEDDISQPVAATDATPATGAALSAVQADEIALDGIVGYPKAAAPLPAQNAQGAVATPQAATPPLAKPQENVGCKICRELGFDLLLTAHQHMEQPLTTLHGTAVLQLPPNAEKYAQLALAVPVPAMGADASITTTRPTHIALQGALQHQCAGAAVAASGAAMQKIEVQNMDKCCTQNQCARIVSAQHIAPTAAPNPTFLAQMQPPRAAAAQWLAQPAGSIAGVVPAVTDKIALALGEAQVAQLANFAQLKASGAEVAITALPNQAVSLPQTLTIGDVLTAYPFPNAVMTLAVRGDILAQGIARSASYFAQGADGTLCVARDFVKPKEEHYNYDFFAGVAYTISFDGVQDTVPHARVLQSEATNATATTSTSTAAQTIPQHPTVHDITVNGAPLDPARIYKVAMSDYRATGTGGYDFYADCPCIASHPVDLQELILQTLADHPHLAIPILSQVTVQQ